MIDDWRYDDGKMAERQICLTAFIHEGIPINREVYEFCHYYVSNGMLQVPSTQQQLEEELGRHNGDLYAFVGEKLFKEFSRWQSINERSERQKSNQETNQTSKETS
jgi:hypothetical protein|tara:strand:- start:1044 stop:1361 length:318 start_codon:yes stop_codon:yes gene_type:complete